MHCLFVHGCSIHDRLSQIKEMLGIFNTACNKRSTTAQNGGLTLKHRRRKHSLRSIALVLKSCTYIHHSVGGAMRRREIASEEGGHCGNHRVMTRCRCTFAINDKLFDQASIRVIFVTFFL